MCIFSETEWSGNLEEQVSCQIREEGGQGREAHSKSGCQDITTRVVFFEQSVGKLSGGRLSDGVWGRGIL